MMRISLLLVALFVTATTLSARADDVSVGSLKISNPWARATPKGAAVGAGYMTISNSGNAPDRLVRGSTDISDRFEVHEMSMDKGVMKMRAVTGLEVKPGQTIELKPGGYHVMFVGLKRPLNQGDRINATLVFEKAGSVGVQFDVRGMGAAPAGHNMGH